LRPGLLLSQEHWKWIAGMLLPLFILLLLTAPAQAHDSRPFSITLTEQPGHRYDVRLRVPPTVELDNRPTLGLPEGCRALTGDETGAAARDSARLLLACDAPLAGKSLAVRYPLYNPSLATLFRLRTADGHVATALLSPDETRWQVPAEPSLSQVARAYLALGIEHIWGGIDHLLFVTGLLILAGSMRRVLLAITGFTIAHSITLSLAALGIVRLAVPPVEAAIALSILFLAREIAHPAPDGLARRYPIMVSSSFGLLHGFGFAAALQEVGLPTGELATGLLCFNLGVEVGQILFIAGVIALSIAARALVRRRSWSMRRFAWDASRLAGYGLGIPAGFWFIQRLSLALG
jgi:hydrogenase/urease accessory protein HupE